MSTKVVLFVSGVIGNITPDNAESFFEKLKTMTDTRMFVITDDCMAIRFDSSRREEVSSFLKEYHLRMSDIDPLGEVKASDLPFDSN